MTRLDAIRAAIQSLEHDHGGVPTWPGCPDCAEIAAAREELALAEGSLTLMWQSLQDIASMPTSERNPDGEEQAAHSMQLVAQETMDALPWLRSFVGGTTETNT